MRTLYLLCSDFGHGKYEKEKNFYTLPVHELLRGDFYAFMKSRPLQLTFRRTTEVA